VDEVDDADDERAPSVELDTERSSARALKSSSRTSEQRGLQRSRVLRPGATPRRGGHKHEKHFKKSRSQVEAEPATPVRASGRRTLEKWSTLGDGGATASLQPGLDTLHYEGGSKERRASSKRSSPQDNRLGLPAIAEDGDEASSQRRSRVHRDEASGHVVVGRRNSSLGLDLEARPARRLTLTVSELEEDGARATPISVEEAPYPGEEAPAPFVEDLDDYDSDSPAHSVESARYQEDVDAAILAAELRIQRAIAVSEERLQKAMRGSGQTVATPSWRARRNLIRIVDKPTSTERVLEKHKFPDYFTDLFVGLRPHRVAALCFNLVHVLRRVALVLVAMYVHDQPWIQTILFILISEAACVYLD